MAGKGFVERLGIASLLAASALGGEEALAQPAQTPAAPGEDAKIQIQKQQEAATAALLMDRALHGNVTLLDICIKPRYANVRLHVQQAGMGVINENLINKSPVLTRILGRTTLREAINSDGTENTDLLEEKKAGVLHDVYAQLARSGATLEEAAHDRLIASHIEETTLIRPGSTLPAMHTVLKNTKVRDVLDKEGAPDSDKLEVELAKAIDGLPLSDLERSDMQHIKDLLLERNKDPKNPDQTSRLERVMTQPDLSPLPDTTVKLGNVLKPGELRIDDEQLHFAMKILDQETIRYGLKHAREAADKGANVYDYLQAKNDITGKVREIHVNYTTLPKEIVTGYMPEQVIKHLKNTPLSQVLRASSGMIDDDRLTDAVIDGIKDEKLMFLTKYPKLSDVLLGNEVSALVQGGFLYDTETRLPIVKDTPIGLFHSGGDAQVAKTIRDNFERDAYPPEQRAADMIAHAGNPWGHLAVNGTTVIPYSYDIKGNTTLTSIYTDVKSPVPLTEENRAMQEYVHWTYERAINLRHEKTDILPTKSGMQWGVLYYNADLSSMTLDSKLPPEKPAPPPISVAGVAMGAYGRVYARVDNVLDVTSQSLPTRLHETGHALGFSHDFRPEFQKPLPGTRDEKGMDKSTPGITRDHSVMPYQRGTYLPLTPMGADYIAGRVQYGMLPHNAGDTTYTLYKGTIDDVVKNRDSSKLWLSTDSTLRYSQTIVDDGGNNTLDVSTINGVPTESSVALDLSKSRHPLRISELGTSTTPMMMGMVAQLGTIDNAVVGYGDVSGNHRANRLEQKGIGKLDGREGDDVLIGGINTVFTGGAGKDTFVMRKMGAAGQENRVTDYAPADDKIVAPEGAVRATFSVTGSILDPDGVAVKGKNGALVRFEDAKGDTLMSALLVSETPLREADIHIESTDGKKLPVAGEPQAKREHENLVEQNALQAVGALLRGAGGLKEENQGQSSFVARTSSPGPSGPAQKSRQ